MAQDPTAEFFWAARPVMVNNGPQNSSVNSIHLHGLRDRPRAHFLFELGALEDGGIDQYLS